MNSLSSKMSVKALKKAIDNLPKTLDQLYDDAFQRIDNQNEDDKEIANKALRWVAYAYQPLTVQILGEILAVDTESQDFDCEAMPVLVLVLDVCAGLLIIDEQTQHVRLVHYTAQDYFDALVDSRFRDAHELIARDCITFLGYDTFQCPPVVKEDDSSSGGSDVVPDSGGYSDSAESGDNDLDENEDIDEPLRNWKREYHLLPYASCFWARHAVAGEQINLSAQINEYLARNPRVWLCNDTRIKLIPVPEMLTSKALRQCTGCGIAAYFGLCEALKLILPMTDNINMVTYGGVFPLHLAAEKDQAAAIETLLEHGADIECKCKFASTTPLLHSIRWGSQTAARVLLDHGADPVCHDDQGRTPFATFAWDSPIPILEQLLKCGANIDSRESCGRTQLMRRAERNDAQTIQWLLEHGASVNLQDRDKSTALSHALRNGSVQSAQLLFSCGADPTMLDKFDRTTLHYACSQKNIVLVKLLLNEGISIDEVDDYGRTALHYAVRNYFSEAVDLLLANHAEIDKQDGDGNTPLMEAVEIGSADIIKLLVANHAEIDKSNDDGRTPLMEAVEYMPTDVMNALLTAGANVDAKDHLDLTVLHCAAAAGNVATITGLLKFGAIRATRSQMMLSVIHRRGDGVYLSGDLDTSTIGEQTVAKHNDDVDSYLQNPNDVMKVSFFSRQNLQNLSPWEARRIMKVSGQIEDCRIWANGITALDIAVICKDTNCSSLLKTLPGMSRTEYSTTDFREYIADLFGLPDMEAVVKELERREEDEEQESLSSRVPSEERLIEDEGHDEAETKEAETAAETD